MPQALIRPLLLAALVLSSATARAQTPPVPIRHVSAPSATSQTAVRGPMGGMRELPGRRLLINDQLGRRVLLLDSTLAVVSVLIDSAPGLANSYPRTGSPLVPYRGDTTLFVDTDARVFLVIEPSGTVGRTMAPPKAQDMTYLRLGGWSDPDGRVYYRGQYRPPSPPPTPGSRPVEPSAAPDSQPIVRADFDTRQVDTVAWFRTPASATSRIQSDPTTGNVLITMVMNPVPPANDEWVVLDDGSIAILRGLDYHVDWIRPDGARRAGPKMPYDWVRLSDDDKQAKLDSARTVFDSMTAAGRNPYAVMNSSDGRMRQVVEFAPITAIPDYIPPFRSGAMQPDRDGNLWILPTMSAAARGGLLYDVVNRDGELVERVQLPAARRLLGFGPGGVVYLMRVNQGSPGWLVERVRVLRDGVTQ